MEKLSYEKRLRWFHQARFGMFIHWGLYSLLKRGEWVMFQERIRAADYARLADRFQPKRFDADAWAGLAAEAGMKYVVFTTRHHDGFCLFDSQVSDFTSMKTAARRDFVAEYVRACHRVGLKVGLYHSVLDWRFPGYFEPRRYKASAEALVQQLHDQVRELLTQYGRIDVLWYDGDWVSHGMAKVRDVAKFWRAKELNAMAHRLQPQMLINNRCGTKEDLDTPEQHVTASQPGRGWESCMTMGDSMGWGYIERNSNWKSTSQLLSALVTAAAGEGNFLLNIGPKPDGSIRREEAVRLRVMGRWLKTNGGAIYGSQRCDLNGGFGGRTHITNTWTMIGTWTRRGNTGYLHVARWPGTEAVLPLVKTKVLSARLLATGRPVKVRQEYNARLILSGLPARPPQPLINVVEVKFAGEPHRLMEPDRAAWLEGRAE